MRSNLELVAVYYLEDFEIENRRNQETDEYHNPFDGIYFLDDAAIQRSSQAERNEWNREQADDNVCFKNTTYGDHGIATHVQPSLNGHERDHKDGDETEKAANPFHENTCHKAQVWWPFIE